MERIFGFGGILGTFYFTKLIIFDERAIKPSKISKLAQILDTEQIKYNFEFDNDKYVQNLFETPIMGVL